VKTISSSPVTVVFMALSQQTDAIGAKADPNLIPQRPSTAPLFHLNSRAIIANERSSHAALGVDQSIRRTTK